MNAASRELLRQNLLVQLSAVAPHALRAATLKVGAIAGGFQVSDQELAAELAYLQEKSLVAAGAKLISPENPEWKITADGRDFLAMKGLA